MPRPAILADMNLSPETVAALRTAGWDAVRVSDLLPPNASDNEILDLARSLDRVVLTHDLDFSTLLALGGYSRPSLVTVRMSTAVPASVSRRLLDVSRRWTQLSQGCAVTVEDVTVRVRTLPIT